MGPRTRIVAVGALTASALAGRASACLWDDDTLRAETVGLPDVVAVATGRFERNPPLYYEVRLARAVETIAKDPDAFAAYDNAGVACDRLGRGADAVAWMEKMRARLAARPDDAEHAYRLHANLGTLLAHDWLRRGADRSDTSEMKRGRDEIAEAIRINPDAHFGREKVQLAAMDWILDPPPADARGKIPDLLGLLDQDRRGAWNPEDAARGLAGLVALGNAWESVDVFETLGAALLADSHAKNANVAALAFLRRDELLRAGKRSLHPQATAGAVWREADGYRLWPARQDAVADWFARARTAADRWNSEREAFMVPRLREGRHPDWDPTFWDGFAPSADAAAPSMFRADWNAFWGEAFTQTWSGPGVLVQIVLPIVAAPAALVIWTLRRRRRKRAAARASEVV